MENKITLDPKELDEVTGGKSEACASSGFKTYFKCPKCGSIKYVAGNHLGEKLPCETAGCTGIMTGAQDPLGR